MFNFINFFLAQVSTYGGQVTSLSGVNTPLGQVMGLMAKIGCLVGAAIIYEGLTMDHGNGRYKSVLLRGALFMAAGILIAVLFSIFYPGQTPITALFQ